MKDIEHIEEQLNAYLDGELDERAANEIKRLLDNDKNTAQLCDSIKRYKQLMDTAEQLNVPEGMLENLTKQLERHVLLSGTETHGHKSGKRHLLIRRFLTAAAAVLLLAILSYVVLDIFVPKSSRDKMFASMGEKNTLKKEVLYEKPFDSTAQEPEKDEKVVIPDTLKLPKVAVLKLTTENSIEIDWLVAKAINATELFRQTAAVERTDGQVKYVLNCSKDDIEKLLKELNFIWPQCRNTQLQLATAQIGKYQNVDNISCEQIIEICSTENSTVRQRMAADIAFINKTANAENMEKYYAFDDNIDYQMLAANKPALTADMDKNEPNSLPETTAVKNVNDNWLFTIIIYPLG